MSVKDFSPNLPTRVQLKESPSQYWRSPSLEMRIQEDNNAFRSLDTKTYLFQKNMQHTKLNASWKTSPTKTPCLPSSERKEISNRSWNIKVARNDWESKKRASSRSNNEIIENNMAILFLKDMKNAKSADAVDHLAKEMLGTIALERKTDLLNIYNAIFSEFATRESISLAKSYFKQMVSLNIEPTGRTHKIFVEGYVREEKIVQAIKHLDKRVTNFQYTPSHEIASLILDDLVRRNAYEEAKTKFVAWKIISYVKNDTLQKQKYSVSTHLTAALVYVEAHSPQYFGIRTENLNETMEMKEKLKQAKIGYAIEQTSDKSILLIKDH